MHPPSRRLSAAAVRFMAVLFPLRIVRLLPTGGRSFPPDRNGVPTFRTRELRPVSGAPCTPGPWCSPGRVFIAASTAALQRPTRVPR